VSAAPIWVLMLIALVLAVFAGGAALVVLVWLRRKRGAPRGFDVVGHASDREVAP